MNANYETFAAYERIVETGNAHYFRDKHPNDNAKFLKDAFSSGTDSFITTDPVLSRIDYRKIELFPLAACLSCAGGGAALDSFCADWLTLKA